jgi:hypothetical protein
MIRNSRRAQGIKSLADVVLVPSWIGRRSNVFAGVSVVELGKVGFSPGFPEEIVTDSPAVLVSEECGVRGFGISELVIASLLSGDETGAGEAEGVGVGVGVAWRAGVNTGDSGCVAGVLLEAAGKGEGRFVVSSDCRQIEPPAIRKSIRSKLALNL